MNLGTASEYLYNRYVKNTFTEEQFGGWDVEQVENIVPQPQK